MIASFAVNSVLLWTHGIRDNNGDVFASQSSATRGWVDQIVPDDQSVTLLQVQPSGCQRALGYAYMLTEFFNDRVDATPQLGVAPYGGLPNETVHVSGGGHLIGLDGRALRSSWVVAPSGVKASGTPVAEGTVDRLVLWHVPAGRVEVHAASDHQVESQACRGTPS